MVKNVTTYSRLISKMNVKIAALYSLNTNNNKFDIRNVSFDSNIRLSTCPKRKEKKKKE